MGLFTLAPPRPKQQGPSQDPLTLLRGQEAEAPLQGHPLLAELVVGRKARCRAGTGWLWLDSISKVYE